MKEHVPKKFGIEDTRKYDFKEINTKQRIAAMASIVAERIKGDLFIDVEKFDPQVEPPRLNSEEIVVGATVDNEGILYARYPVGSQAAFYHETVPEPIHGYENWPEVKPIYHPVEELQARSG